MTRSFAGQISRLYARIHTHSRLLFTTDSTHVIRFSDLFPYPNTPQLYNTCVVFAGRALTTFFNHGNLDSISTRFFFPHSHLVCVLNKTISHSFLLDTYFVHTLSFHTHILSVFFFIPSVAYRFLNAPSVYTRVCENDRSDNETTTYRFYQSHIIVIRTLPYSGRMYVPEVAAFEVCPSSRGYDDHTRQ